MATLSTEQLTALPDVPKEFGDDGGHFYRYYDKLADELDEDLVQSLKAQLDGLLSSYVSTSLPSLHIFRLQP